MIPAQSRYTNSIPTPQFYIFLVKITYYDFNNKETRSRERILFLSQTFKDALQKISNIFDILNFKEVDIFSDLDSDSDSVSYISADDSNDYCKPVYTITRKLFTYHHESPLVEFKDVHPDKEPNFFNLKENTTYHII